MGKITKEMEKGVGIVILGVFSNCRFPQTQPNSNQITHQLWDGLGLAHKFTSLTQLRALNTNLGSKC